MRNADESSGPILAVRHVQKTARTDLRRRPIEILKGVDFEVGTNGVFGLLGPNGAGKTTTVKVALGLMRPTAGRVELGVGRERVGYLPENPYFYSYLSGREFLGFCGALFGLASGERRARVNALLDEVGLRAAAGTQLRKYSKGMLQRIGIAQALVNDPELLLLDEPMTGLDPIGRLEVKRLIQRLHGEGKTVLFNSHVMADVEELCTHIGIMDRGVVLWTGTVAEALEQAPTLEAFFMKTVGSAREAPGPGAAETAT